MRDEKTWNQILPCDVSILCELYYSGLLFRRFKRRIQIAICLKENENTMFHENETQR